MPRTLLARTRTELPDQYRSWVRTAAVGTALGYGMVAAAAFWVDPTQSWLRKSEIPAFVLCLVAVWLQARRRAEASVSCLLAAVWFESHWSLATSPDGIYDASGFPLVGLVVGSVVFLGSRTALLVTAATTVTVPAAVAVGHWLGCGPGIPPKYWIYWIALVVTMWVCLALLNLLVRSFELVLERARRNEQGLRELVHGSPDAMIGLSANGHVESFNPTAERLLDLSATEAMGQHFDTLPLTLPSGALPSGESDTGPREILADRSGRTLEALFRGTPREDGSAGTLMVLRDVTQRKQAELKAQELQRQLLHSQKLEAVGFLAGGVAHDFNNLLTAVAGYGSLAAKSADPMVRSMGQELITVQERGAALTRQLLSFARKEVPQPRTTGLGKVVADTRPLLRHLLGERIELELATDDACPVFVDPGQVQQVLLNLAANARDAMPRGGAFRVACRSAGDRVELRVADTGTGIAPELQSRIFEPFFTTKPRGQGTGLGLATVRSIVDDSGGRIEVESEVGHGTTFRVFWPRSSGVPEDAAARLPSRDSGSGRGRLLVVEDDAQARKILRLALEAAGYEVAVDATAEDALERAQAGMPDLLLSDVMLPGMTGVDLALRLREQCPALPVLFVSGYLHDVLAHAPFDPVRDLLSKPFTVDALLCRVAEKLGQQT
jgi:two-component system, cell cycle sensor histidine kinase and response regulator CckA